MTDFEMPVNAGGEGRATIRAASRCPPPALANSSRGSGRRKAIKGTSSALLSPSDDIIPASAGGEGAARFAAQPRRTAPPLADTIAALVEIGARRRFAIKQQIVMNNALGAYARRLLGWRVDAEKAERERIAKAAARLVAQIEKGEAVDSPTAPALAPLVASTVQGRAAFDALRDEAERTMRKLVRQMPPYEWAQGVRGFGDLALAVIVSEAGDIGTYDGPARLWKRLGLAVIDGERQQRKTDAELAVRHGYNPRRRAQVYAFIDDAMLRAQWRGEKDSVVAHAIGPYGEVYGRKKAEYLERCWTPIHAERGARRYMAKRLIRDLWREWRRATSGSPPGEQPPAATPPEDRP